MFHNNKGKYPPYNLNPGLYLYAFNHADFTHMFLSLYKLAITPSRTNRHLVHWHLFHSKNVCLLLFLGCIRFND